MTVWGNVWNISFDPDTEDRSCSISKQDINKLQILQNKTLRLLTGLDYSTPVSVLFTKTNQLSTHQLIAYHTACQMFNIFLNKLPSYHYDRLFTRDNVRESRVEVNMINFNLGLAKGSFFYQGPRIWGRLPSHVRNSANLVSFKTGCRKWIRDNIAIRP